MGKLFPLLRGSTKKDIEIEGAPVSWSLICKKCGRNTDHLDIYSVEWLTWRSIGIRYSNLADKIVLKCPRCGAESEHDPLDKS